MVRIREFLGAFARDEKGATAIEYGLIAALIATVLIAGMAVLGDGLTAMFDTVAAALTGS